MKLIINGLLIGCSTFTFQVPSLAEPEPKTTTLFSQSRHLLSQKAPVFTKAQATPSITDPEEVLEIVSSLEKTWEGQYANHFDLSFSSSESTDDISPNVRTIQTSLVTPTAVEQNLKKGRELTQSRAAFIWMNAYPDYLRITISTETKTQVYDINISRTEVITQVERLVKSIKHPYLSPKNDYLPPAQKLYEWMIQPLASTLEKDQIDSLIFCLGKGLRLLPLAALHDGETFLVEKYAVSRLPAFSLTDMTAESLKTPNILAMGASEFEELISLPAVPIELNTIVVEDGNGESFLNRNFTLNNLTSQLETEPFEIVHLATHAKIESGKPKNSYIQFWNEQLNLDEAPRLSKETGWSNIQLLVLSACETAVINQENNRIDEQVEMSFAGLALQAGVKSVIASSWDVSDQGTLGLMAQFYEELPTAPTKTIALQRAQLALLNQNVRFEGKTLSNLRSSEPLPESLFSRQQEFSHPYYWATFTVIGNPW